MKKWSILTVLVFVVGLLAVSTASAQLTTTNTFNKDNPMFGGASQEASNPEHDETSQFDVFVTQTVSFKNNGDEDITITSVEPINVKSEFTNEFKIELVDNSVTIKPTESKGVQLRARIPKNLDAVNDKFEKVAFLIGSATFKIANTSSVGTFEVWMERENNLDINDIDAVINGKGKQSIDDGDDIENLKPGDNVELEVQGENTLDDETNLDIENVDLKISCTDESNFDFDDKTQDIGDIGTEDEETETLTFDVEDDAKDENTNCDVTVGGRDENGAFHGELINFGVEVVRKNHDLLIKSLNANPSSLSCDDKNIELRVDYINLGKSNEDRIAIEVTSKFLGYQDRVSSLELDEDDRDEKVFLVPVDPRQVKQGPFVFQVQTFYDNTKLSDTSTLTMDNLCSEAEPVSTGGTRRTTTDTGKTTTTVTNALAVSTEKIKLAEEALASIAVKVTNRESDAVEYTVSVANTEDFSEPSSSKKVFLNPGQESTVFLNLKAKEDVAAGTYSGTVVLKNQRGDTLETKSFTVEKTGEAKSTSAWSWFGGDSDSRIFWIIGDIILIIVAIFFIKLIFTGGRKKSKAKKMADYEADAAMKKRR